MKNQKLHDTICLLITYSNPLIEGGRDHARICGLCKRQLIEAKEAKIELKKKNPNLKDFFIRVETGWKRTKHYRLFKKLQDSGINDFKKIEKEFQKRGLEL